MSDKYTNVTETCRILGCTRQTVYNLYHAGKIEGRMVQRRLFPLTESVEALKVSGYMTQARRRAQAKPNGCPLVSGKRCNGYTVQMCDACPLPECVANTGQTVRMMEIDRKKSKTEAEDYMQRHPKLLRSGESLYEYGKRVMIDDDRRIKI